MTKASIKRKKSRVVAKRIEKDLPEAMKAVRAEAKERIQDLDTRIQGAQHQQERHLALNKRVQELADAFSINSDVFAGGFEAADRRIYTMMRVMNEMYFRPGSIHLKRHEERVTDAETGEKYIQSGQTIDWTMYFAEYDAIQALVLLAENVRETYASKDDSDSVADGLVNAIFGGTQGLLS